MTQADDALTAARALEAAAQANTDTVQALIATDDETLATAAALHLQDVATHAADEAVKAAQAQQIAELEAELAAGGPTPPPPPTRTLFGTTHQGAGISPKAMRVYDGNPLPKLWKAGSAAGVPPGCLPVMSIMKNNTARGWAKVPASGAAVQAFLASIQDIDVLLGMCHEAEHGVYNFELASDATLYDSDQAAFEAAVAVVNVKRAHPIRTYRCIMGATLNTPKALLDLAMASIAKHNAMLAPDIYDARQIAPAIALAAKLGVDWCVPEWGNGVIVDGKPETEHQLDTDVLPAMQSQAPLLVKGGASPICWFWSGSRNELDDKPLSRAFLQSLAA